MNLPTERRQTASNGCWLGFELIRTRKSNLLSLRVIWNKVDRTVGCRQNASKAGKSQVHGPGSKESDLVVGIQEAAACGSESPEDRSTVGRRAWQESHAASWRCRCSRSMGTSFRAELQRG